LLLRVALLVIGVVGITAAALSPIGRIFGLPLAALSLLVLASLTSRAGKLVTQLAQFRGKPVTILLWGAPPEQENKKVFRVRTIRAFGAGLHLWLERSSGGDCAHLKIAQPNGALRVGDEFRIAGAAYVQWAGRKVPRRTDVSAVVLTTAASVRAA
jgi:hypothetical protein